MKTHQTIAGNAYVVYSKDGCTVTDSTGTLNKEVPAGDFLTIPAPSDALITSDDNALVRKANFKLAAFALRLLGGGNNGLPAGYTRVEFLESTGAQYIDTGVVVTEFCNFEVEFQATREANAIYIFNARPNDYVNQILLAIRPNRGGGQGDFIFQEGAVGKSWVKPGEYYNKTHVVKKGTTVSLNGYVQTLSKSSSYNTVYTLPLFASKSAAPTVSDKASLKLWRFSLETLNAKREYIPALDKTGTPCMFDLVTRKPFYNSGTGDFLYPGKETQATTYSLRRPRMYAQMTEHGIRRLYHVPRGFNCTPEEYAEEHGFKILVETPAPEEGYWAPQWHEREDCIELEWVETEPPAEEEILTAE